MENDQKPILVTQPSLPPLDELLPYLEQIWESRTVTNGGPFHEQLEQALCDYLQVPYISLFANGTIALVTALKALDLQGEVITTPYTFVATAHSLVWNGIKPVFVDIDPVTLNLDPSKTEAAITENTSAILPVHVYGHPCDVDAIELVAKKHGLRVIYDAAHAFGVRCHCGSILNHGDLSVLSFHATKVFNTFEGGAIVCQDLETKMHIDQLKNFGFVSETSVVQTGINGKMNEFSAALGLLQLKYIDEAIEKRRMIDTLYRRELAGIPGIRCHVLPDSIHRNYSYFPIFIENRYPMSRDELYDKLKANGIHTRRYFYPLVTDHAFQRKIRRDNLNVSRKTSDSVLCLPLFPSLRPNQCRHITNAILEARS